MKKLNRSLCIMLTVLSGLFVMGCSKQDRSSSNTANGAMTVARSVLPKVSFTDSNFTVPIEVASVLAANLNKIMPGVKFFKRNVALSVENSFTINDSAGNPNMYIFNYKDDGYAVFSADERHSPLLAVVEKGKFEKRAVSAGLINWFNVTMNYINLAKTGKMDTKSARTQWHRFFSATFADRDVIGCCPECPSYPECLDENYQGFLCNSSICNDDPCGVATYDQEGPYITTVWGQGCGYNDFSPDFSCAGTGCFFNSRVPTGCVATAMAQIIKYWAHPSHQSYNYAIMPDNNNDPWLYTSEVPRLMRDAGDAVGMTWSCNASSAYVSNIPQALKDSFAYNNGSHTNIYSSIRGLIVANLNSGIPAILGACAQEIRHGFWPFYTYEYDVCHAWICDGYIFVQDACNTVMTFHINWGWGGEDDGYFFYNNWDLPIDGVGAYQYAHSLAYNLFP